MKIELKIKRIIATIIIAVLMYFAVPYLFVGNILKKGIEVSQKQEKIRIQKILDENPEFAEKYRAWKNDEIELTREEIDEQIYKVLPPEAFED